MMDDGLWMMAEGGGGAAKHNDKNQFSVLQLQLPHAHSATARVLGLVCALSRL
jgi:hypothetical protein